MLCLSGDLTSLLTVIMPESREYYHYFTDEKDEARGQNLSNVLKSVNDETRLRLRSDLSQWWMVSVHKKCIEYTG